MKEIQLSSTELRLLQHGLNIDRPSEGIRIFPPDEPYEHHQCKGVCTCTQKSTSEVVVAS